jgi:hypothetical protein
MACLGTPECLTPARPVNVALPAPPIGRRPSACDMTHIVSGSISSGYVFNWLSGR